MFHYWDFIYHHFSIHRSDTYYNDTIHPLLNLTQQTQLLSFSSLPLSSLQPPPPPSHINTNTNTNTNTTTNTNTNTNTASTITHSKDIPSSLPSSIPINLVNTSDSTLSKLQANEDAPSVLLRDYLRWIENEPETKLLGAYSADEGKGNYIDDTEVAIIDPESEVDRY